MPPTTADEFPEPLAPTPLPASHAVAREGASVQTGKMADEADDVDPTGQSAEAPADAVSPTKPKRWALVPDSLASAVLTMVVVTVVQRGTGFLRSVLICRFLAPEELGYWNMAKSFLILAAPLIVLGLPGSFKRYLAYYRERGQLIPFVRRTTRVTTSLTLIGAALVLVFRNQVSWATFGTEASDALVFHVGIALLFVIAFNFSTELLTALRQVRAVSLLQLANSLLFTVVSLGLVAAFGFRAEGVVIGFSLANLVTAVGGVWVVRQCLAEEPAETSPSASPSAPIGFWHKVAPFAAWFWLGDLLGNLFTNVDRLMVVHLAKGYGLDGLALVGQYHSSQMIGLLLVGLTGILGSVLLSYLSHDWESGNQAKAAYTLDFAIKLVALSLTAGAAIALLLAPVIFQRVLNGRYEAGFDVLPLTMSYCIWFGLLSIAHNFLWCREKAWWVSGSLTVGLVVNVLLNYAWFPRWGLEGVVAATATANLTTLAIVFLMGHRLGMRYSWGSVVAVTVPISLCGGGWLALGTVCLVTTIGLKGRWLFTRRQQQRLEMALADGTCRVRKVAAGLSRNFSRRM